MSPKVNRHGIDLDIPAWNAYGMARIPALILKALYYRVIASEKLPGRSFDSYGRMISILFLLRGKPRIFLDLLCNPVSIVRYFEFAFALESVCWPSVRKCLDLSSPRLFFMYLLKKYPHIHVDFVNPDEKDIGETLEYLDVLRLTDRTCVAVRDALQIPFPDNSYDVVTSISVLEHIPDDEDIRALRKLWNLLKPDGRLILTVPCARSYFEEWREGDIYGLGAPEKHGRRFFQRIYDPPTLRKRIIDVLGTEPVRLSVFGEKEKGIYKEYEKRWAACGLRETIRDPLHVVSDYRYFPGIENLEGIGVCGLIFTKGGIVGDASNTTV